MKPKPDGGKKKNPGSPQAAAERQMISSYVKGATSAGRDASTKKRIASTNAAKNATTRATNSAKYKAGASRDASTKKEMDKKAMTKFGGYLKATDVKGKGASAAAGRRQAALKGYVGQAGRKAANTGRPKSLPKTK
jgi:hypothetical protein